MGDQASILTFVSGWKGINLAQHPTRLEKRADVSVCLVSRERVRDCEHGVMNEERVGILMNEKGEKLSALGIRPYIIVIAHRRQKRCGAVCMHACQSTGEST